MYIACKGGGNGDNYGTDVRPDISKPTPFIYLGSENWDPFIYLPFEITTYTYTSIDVSKIGYVCRYLRTNRFLLLDWVLLLLTKLIAEMHEHQAL